MLRKLVALPNKLMKQTYKFSVVDWQQIPKPYNVSTTVQQKKLLKHPTLKPLPKYMGTLNDSLHIPGMEGQSLLNIYIEFVQAKDTPLSPQFVGFFLYNFSKQGYLNPSTWTKIQPYIGRNRGQYSMRSIFGCLYGCIRYGSLQYIQFFVQEMAGQKVSFSDLEAIEIIEAFNSANIQYSIQFKHEFWNRHFRDHFKSTIKQGVRIHNYKLTNRIFKAFDKFQYYQDVELWNLILSWFQRKKGWKRTQIIQKLYPLTGTFDKAKELFDHYYAQLSSSEEVLWRYNLQELRFYTSEEMIAKSQTNIKMIPSDRTIVKRKDQARFNQEYYEWLKDGARQKEDELIKDKAQSLAFAIKDRYDSMKKDNADFSKLSTEQFQDLFGVYDPDMMYRPPKENGQLQDSQKLEQQLKMEALQRQSSKNRKKQKKQK